MTEDATREGLLEAWRTNDRISLFLIERISEAGLRCTLSRHGGRDVAAQFAHMHNFVAHESHHRGSILLTLKQCGHKLDPTAANAIWDWDRI